MTKKNFSIALRGLIYIGIIGTRKSSTLLLSYQQTLVWKFLNNYFFLHMIKCEQSIYDSIIWKRKSSSLFWAYQRIFVRTFDKKDTFFAVFQWSEKETDNTIWFSTPQNPKRYAFRILTHHHPVPLSSLRKSKWLGLRKKLFILFKV